MSKSVLVIDRPESCLDCQFCYELDEGVEAYCSIMNDDEDKSLMKEIDCEDGYCQGNPNWCPLKELPEEDNEDYFPDEYESGYASGWNACLREITGQVKENY